MIRSSIDAMILDMDGVVTHTAKVHARAWKTMFDDYLRQRAGGENFEPFDLREDYRRYVDGKPRYDGVRTFLSARDIELPEGTPEDPPGTETICGLGNRKNELFNKQLSEGAEAYEDAVAKLKEWREQGLKTAIVSSSRNCEAVLAATGVSDLFDVRVDGVTADELGLKGKPAPDLFLKAAEKLGVEPDKSVVFEDAIAGVQAGRRGHFALVVGVARDGNGAELLEHGAEIVVERLDEFTFETLPKRAVPPEVPSVREVVDAVLARADEREVAIFLDYDGTLTPIVAQPDAANLSDSMRSTLRRLAHQCTVAIVSGRDRADVETRVGIEHLVYAGSHGFDISGPETHFQQEQAREALPELDEAERELEEALKDVKGSLVERKRFSIATHYRNVADEDVDRVAEAVEQVRNRHPSLRRGSGKRVYELQPDIDWHKGRAVAWLMEALDLKQQDALAIYIGDDTTDEDAFRTLREDGVGIYVGETTAETEARYVLSDTTQVEEFLETLAAALACRAAHDLWKLVYTKWDPQEQPLRETLCTLGNGAFATRGAAEETGAGGPHYPGMYVAGGYNRLESEVSGRIIENEDLVNWPNWLCLSFRPEGGAWLDLDKVEVRDFRQELDIHRGILTRRVRVRDAQDRETTLVSRRIVHMDEPHVAAIEWTIKPENWSGRVEVRSALDGNVINYGVARYRALNSRHLEFIESGLVGEEGIYLIVETNQSHMRMAQAARTRAYCNGDPVPLERETHQEEAWIGQTLSFECQKARPVTIEKIVAIRSSRDPATSEPGYEARKQILRVPRFGQLLESHTRTWRHLWHAVDIHICGDSQVQRILRLHIFHLLQTVSWNSIDRDMGVPARGWHGEAYRGHIFWDELFILPFLSLRLPELTRDLLMYRYRRLREARWEAQEAGFKGAMYPWQSGSNGREESQVIHLNPKSGRWLPDNTHLQRHVNGAIALNIWRYYEATSDLEFLSFYGGQMLLEIAQFFSSLATFNPDRNRYEIHNVVGPDEYHTRYPDSDEPGLRNNAYTNVLAAWTLMTACKLVDMLAEDDRSLLLDTSSISAEDVERWDRVSRALYIPFHENGIISQFEGYESLEEFDWKAYRAKYGDIQRLDRILEAENDSTNRYKLAKQADVLMLFYLFSAEELTSIFQHMSYDFDRANIPRIVDYYSARTSHGSTLSEVVHSWVYARSERERSWRSFQKALESDLRDVQGGTTQEGIHLGAMAATVDLAQRCFTGLEIRDDVLWLNPFLPSQLAGLRMRIRYRGHWLSIGIEHERMDVCFERGPSHEVRVGVCGKVYTFNEGQHREFALSSGSQPCQSPPVEK